MKIGQLLIKKEDEMFLIKHNGEVLGIGHSLERANTLALQLSRAYEIGYKRAGIDSNNKMIDSKKYHYMWINVLKASNSSEILLPSITSKM